MNHTSDRTFCTRSRLKIVFLKSVLRKRLWLEHVCKVSSRLALLLRVYNVLCVEAVFGPFGGLGGIFRYFFLDFIAFVENGVCETAVGVHFGAQNCSENDTFFKMCDKISMSERQICAILRFYCISQTCKTHEIHHFCTCSEKPSRIAK